MGKYYRVLTHSDENSLAHYGIKGQKWGIRRFQYDNGSYTPEGKERYRKSDTFGGGTFGKSNARKGGPAGSLASEPLKVAVASFVVNQAAYRIRRHNARKEVDRADLNKDTERVTKKNLNRMAMRYNKKERSQIIQKMKDDPDITFDEAEKPVKKAKDERIRRNTAIFLAANIVIPVALAYTYMHRHSISDKLHRADNAVHRNKMYQAFMKSAKNRKVRNSVVLRRDEYEIDRRHNLPSGRG